MFMDVLQTELAQAKPLSRDARELLASSVLPILALAERHITEAELERLEDLIATLPDHPPQRGPSEFRIQLWLTIANATRNPFVTRNVTWWAQAMRQREQRTGIDSSGPARIIPKAMYRGLILALRRGSGASEFWAQVIDQVID
jgi:DNA-binding FadR family transcriptional regulator